MSSYLVDNKTINNVVSFLDIKSMGSESYLFKIMGYNLNQKEQLEKLGQDMHNLNEKAVSVRYSEISPPSPYKYVFSIGGNPYQVLKSLQCWIYQCSEGSIPKEADLYKTMRDLERTLLLYIVEKIEAYQQAKWA